MSQVEYTYNCTVEEAHRALIEATNMGTMHPATLSWLHRFSSGVDVGELVNSERAQWEFLFYIGETDNDRDCKLLLEVEKDVPVDGEPRTKFTPTMKFSASAPFSEEGKKNLSRELLSAFDNFWKTNLPVSLYRQVRGHEPIGRRIKEAVDMEVEKILADEGMLGRPLSSEELVARAEHSHLGVITLRDAVGSAHEEQQRQVERERFAAEHRAAPVLPGE
jgi:hypothetical protein